MRDLRAMCVALAVVLALLAAGLAVAPGRAAQAQEPSGLATWEPGGRCFTTREPTPQEVEGYGVPEYATGAHVGIVWLGPDEAQYRPGCVPPGYEWTGGRWDPADSPYRMVDCSDALRPDCFWYVTGNGLGGFVWSERAFVAFTDPGDPGPGGGGGGGGPGPQPGPDGAVDCGDGVVLQGAEVDAAVATLEGTGRFTTDGLAAMDADPCRYFPTSCANLSAYMTHLSNDAYYDLRDQLMGPGNLFGVAYDILEDPCPFLTAEWEVAGAIVLPFPGAPAIPVPAPVQLFPPLPFSIPGEGNPTSDPCRWMTDATVEGPVPSAVAAAPKSAEPTLVAAATGSSENPNAQWYEGSGFFALPPSQSAARVQLNGLASPVMGSGEFFGSVLFDSHVSVEVFPGYDPDTCQELTGPRVERIDIRELYEIVGTDMSRFREITRNSHCTRTSLCRRNWEQIPFTDSAPLGGGITSVRHYVIVTVKLEGQAPVTLPSVASQRLAFF